MLYTVYPFIDTNGERQVCYDLNNLIGKDNIAYVTTASVSEDVFKILRDGELKEVKKILADYI